MNGLRNSSRRYLPGVIATAVTFWCDLADGHLVGDFAR